MISSAGHVPPETLADSAEGLLAADDEAAVRAHINGCADCRRVDADLRDVSVFLAADSAPRMPEDVAARLDAALQAEPPLSPATPRDDALVAAAPTRRRAAGRMPVWIGAAAAAAVVGVTGAVLGLQALQGNETTTSTTAGAALEADRSAEAPESTLSAPSSGRAYTADHLTSEVQALVGQSGAADSADEDAADDGREAAAPGTVPGTESAGEPAAAGTDLSALSTLATPAGLAACIEALTGRADVTPVAVDLASFEKQPAAVIVLPVPGDGESLDVRIVGSRCSAADDDVIVATRVPRP
jgi:hypothetical protein